MTGFLQRDSSFPTFNIMYPKWNMYILQRNMNKHFFLIISIVLPSKNINTIKVNKVGTLSLSVLVQKLSDREDESKDNSTKKNDDTLTKGKIVRI